MMRAYTTLGFAGAFAVAATVYAHESKAAQRKRMHEGVLRDIAKEAAEQAAAVGATTQVTTGDGRVCVGDVCSASATRFRDPATGQVYTPDEATHGGGGGNVAA